MVKGEIFGPEQRLFTGVALRGTFKGPPAKQEVSYFPFIPLAGHRRTGSEAFFEAFCPFWGPFLHSAAPVCGVPQGLVWGLCSDVLGMMC